MTAFARFATRFSLAAAAPAKVAKPAKAEAGAAGFSQLSQVSRPAIPQTNNPSLPDSAIPAARRIAASVADGAEREDDPDGWLVLVRPDGRRHIVAPHIVAALDAAGLLPDLPPAGSRSTHSRTARPPSWSDPEDRPREGERCCLCRSGRWWTAEPTLDGWTCSTCHPPPPGLAVSTVQT